jgi:hypothetical protein
MGRKLIVNGEAMDIALDNITAGQLKEELRRERNSCWVAIARGRELKTLSDHEIIPTEVEQVTILPQYYYGR